MLPADVPSLAAVFRASVETLAEEDYNVGQRTAWMSVADDQRAFGKQLQQSLTIVAAGTGALAGFISLIGKDCIDMLYVHPQWARQGVATQLLDAIERLAGARGASRLVTDASDTARPFFEVNGFEPRDRQTVAVGDYWLGRTRMEKTIGAVRR